MSFRRLAKGAVIGLEDLSVAEKKINIPSVENVYHFKSFDLENEEKKL